MALEAVEGTDEAIKRAAKYGGPGFVMGKCSKKEQDFRFDIPTVGLNTLELLLEHQAAGLVIEAEKNFLCLIRQNSAGEQKKKGWLLQLLLLSKEN